MGISLQKGQRISLSKETTGQDLASRISIGLGWDAARGGFLGFGGGGSIDLDASCALFDASGQVVDTVSFQQLTSRCGSIEHSGDNLTGDGEGDDERIVVDLSRVPQNVKTIVFTVNSYRGQTFDKVENAYCRLVNGPDQRDPETLRYNISEKGRHTGMVMISLYRHNNGWKVKAIGETTTGRTVRDLVPEMQRCL